MTQIGLAFDAPRQERAEKPRQLTLAERFEVYIQANGHVYDEIVRLVREKVAAGAKRVGMKAVWEEARWSLRLRGKEEGREYAMNNSMCSFVARRILEREPDLAGVFETRRRGQR